MASNDQNTIRTEYQSLARLVQQQKYKKDFQGVRETLQKMIGLVKAHRESFYESEDRIRSLEFRKSMAAYRQERENRGGSKQINFLREAAEYSTPTVCEGKTCPLNPQHCAQTAMLSNRQKKMCIEKISAISTALKIEAAIAAHRFEYSQALEKRRETANIHRYVVKICPKFDPSTIRKRLMNQRYLDYWHFVTEGYFSLLEGKFDESKKWFKKAYETGQFLPFKNCFPNYFCNPQEIQAHKFYIDAIEKIKLARFAEARDLFQDWLLLGSRETTKLRFDNVRIFEMICNTFELTLKGEVKKEDWDELDRFIERVYVARTTWVLLSKLDWIRELSFKLKEKDSTALKFNLKEEIGKIAKQWQLFVPDAQLLREDRTAGLRRDVNFLSFTDIFNKLNKDNHDWQQLLIQNLKNLLLIMADYEHLRYLCPPTEEAHLPRENHPPVASQKMTIEELIQIILFYLKHRSRRHARIFQNALKHLDNFKLAIKSDDFNEAIKAQKRLFEYIRFWPHVIRVENQKKLRSVFLDEYEPNFLARETVCTRLWSRKPNTIVFEGSQDLRKKCYYYLRPKWNTRLYEHFPPRRIRHEQFLQSDIPKWINVFFENVFGRGEKDDPERFCDWILQFNDRERLLACKLFDMVKFYSEEKVRDMWLRLYREELPPEAKIEEVAYIGLGHTAKSGYYACHYHLRQVMWRGLKRNEYSFEFKKAFREISEYYREKEKPHTVIFVDDFIGKGTQAINWFINREEAYFKKYSWLNEVNVYYCALVGFEEGIETIKAALSPSKIKGVLVSKKLDEKDRAFSPENPNWKSEKERLEAEQWASEIGRQVLTGMSKYDPERDKLGWGNSQALIVFHYNVPNNTLPIFWGEGERNGKKWKPLWIRYD